MEPSAAPPPTAIVTGANSGIGRATALYLAQQGYRVVGTVRSVAKADKLGAMASELGVTVELVELDVADDESVRRGLAPVLERLGGVDLLVNNAGVGPIAVAEHCPTSLYLDTINVNLCGAVRCTQAVLPAMRAAGRGCIINIGSITGVVAASAQSPYAASKFALEGWTDGLAQEVAAFGIRVKLVQAGVTKSAIQAKNSETPNQSGAYTAHYRRMFRFYLAGLAVPTDPMVVAAEVHRAALDLSPTLRYPCSWAGVESIEGRRRMTDADWVGLGAIDDDATYYERFRQFFGVDISPE